MTTFIVSSGQTSSGLTIGDPDSLVVDGGTAIAITITSGGSELILAGVAISTTISKGGQEFVYSGAVSSEVVISAGGEELVSGGTTIGAVVLHGGDLEVGSAFSAGVASNTTVYAGGVMHDSGTMIGTTIESGASVLVGSTASASLTEVMSGATLFVLPGGQDTGTIVDSGGQVVSVGIIIYSGYYGSDVVSYAATISGGVLGSGLREDVFAGGTTVSQTIGTGAIQYVSSGGVASDSVIRNQGIQSAGHGGTTVSTIVASGGYFNDTFATTIGLVVDAGGRAQQIGSSLTDTTISGYADANNGAVADGTRIADGGLFQFGGGTASGTTVDSGGTFEGFQSSVIVSTTVASGGSFVLLADGSAAATHVEAGGTFAVLPGGVGGSVTSDAGANVFISTGVIVVSDYALAAATSGILAGFTVSGEAEAYVRAGGTLLGGVIRGGAMLSSGGTALNTAVSGGGMAVLSGGSAITATAVYGDISVFSGGVAQGTFLGAGGQISAASGGVISGSLDDGGLISVSAGGVAEESRLISGREAIFAGGHASGTQVGSGAIEDIYAAGGATDVQLANGGSIYLDYVSYVSGSTASLNAATDVLTVDVGSATTTVQLAGDYTGEYFRVTGPYTTTITVDGTPCYCRGTLIATDTGETPVEHLRIGDRLLTASGALRPLRWIGRRCYSGRFAAHNRDVLPVIFRAGALGNNLPRRDLHVSPLHAMFIDGVLVPAQALVNGATILQAHSIDQVDYFHLELETHDIILAEGAPSESYIDDDSRGMFHNAAEYRTLYPDTPRAPARFCAPRIEDGPLLEAIRARLAGPAPQPAPLRGFIEHISHDRIIGWASDGTDTPQRLRIVDNGVTLGEATADAPRGDLREAGIGTGQHGFSFVVPGGLAPDARHVIQVQRSTDGAELAGSPAILAAAQHPLPTPIPTLPHQERAPHGSLDHADRDGLRGWAFDPHTPERRVALQILDNGVPIARALANRHRADLVQAGIGDGHCAFDLLFPGGLSPLVRHVVDVRCEHSGLKLPGSPFVLEQADSFDPALQQAIAGAVTALDTEAERDRVLSFLMGQAQRILQQRADADAQRQARAIRDHYRRHHALDITGQDQHAPQRALVIDAAIPTPDRDAGSQAILSHMRALQRAGYEVSLVAAEQMNQMAAHLTATNITHCAAPYYASVEDVLRRQTGCFDLLYLHRAENAEAYMALCRRWMPKARIVYAVADLQYLRLARQAEIEQRPELLAQSRRLRLAECTAAWRADAVLTHSPHEAALLRAAVPQANVHVVPWDVAPRRSRIGFAKRAGVAFIGNYGHSPNVDAAHFLVEEVMPLVWAHDPRIACRLVGAGMTPAIRALAGPGVSVLGQVADLGALLDTVRLTVAPLRYGAGIKGKVLDSLAAGVPCAATPIAAEGIDLPATLVAAGEAELAALILRLHNNQPANRTAARAGRKLIETEHTEAKVDAALGKAIANAARRVA